jgi:hypothetical protein
MPLYANGLNPAVYKLLIPMRISYHIVTPLDSADKSQSGHFVWVNLGGKLGFTEPAKEKRVFQDLLDGGVYIVCESSREMG